MTDIHEGEQWRWTPLPPADDDAEVRRRHEANRAAWNEGAEHEHPDEHFEMFPRVPAEERQRIPHTFSMVARKPRR